MSSVGTENDVAAEAAALANIVADEFVEGSSGIDGDDDNDGGGGGD